MSSVWKKHVLCLTLKFISFMCLDNFNEIKISLHSRNHKVTVSHHEKLYSFRNEDSPFLIPLLSHWPGLHVFFLFMLVWFLHTSTSGLVLQPENVVLLLQVSSSQHSFHCISLSKVKGREQIDNWVNALLPQWIQYESGFLICATFGVVFVVLIPVIAMCFCMCRCCDNCGGEMHQRQRKNADCHRGFYTASLVATTIFIMWVVIPLLHSFYHYQSAILQNEDDFNDTGSPLLWFLYCEVPVRFHLLRWFVIFAYLSHIHTSDHQRHFDD